MSLKDGLVRLVALLEEHPKVEMAAGLATPVAKLKKAIDDFLANSEVVIYRNTAEYSELIALLTKAQNKTLVTPEWLNNHNGGSGKKFAKAGKKEKEEFALRMVKTGAAPVLIKEMKDSPRKRMENMLNHLALASDSEVAAELKAMKAPQLQEFCEFNGIPIAKTAKGALDRKKTHPSILQKLSELREYAKLSSP